MLTRILTNSEALCTFVDGLGLNLSKPQRRHMVNLALLYAGQGNAAQALPLALLAARLLAEIGHAAYAQRARELVAQLQG